MQINDAQKKAIKLMEAISQIPTFSENDKEEVDELRE